MPWSPPGRRAAGGVAVLALVFVGAPRAAAEAGRLDLAFDARLVESDGRRSFLDGGLGKLRYDDEADGLQFGRLRLAWRGVLGETWHASVDASAWSGDEHNPIDLTEALVEWRPVPQSAWRSRLRIGAFYPPISLEHRAAGWTNPYLTSSSALNTWVGEELRTIGVEYRLERSGLAVGSGLDWGVGAALYGWNDPAGIIVATRGWALHDRQTPLFGRTGTLPVSGPEQRVLFEEIDGRPGYYVHGFLRHADRLELRALWYDNRGDPAAFEPSIVEYAWDTRFLAVGARYETGARTTIVSQWLNGVTDVGPAAHDRWTFDSAFLLVSQQLGRHRLSGRVDAFSLDHVRTSFPIALGRERGDAWSVAWTWQATEPLALSVEWLVVDSEFNWRSRLGEAPAALERSLQLGLRYTLSAGR